MRGKLVPQDPNDEPASELAEADRRQQNGRKARQVRGTKRNCRSHFDLPAMLGNGRHGKSLVDHGDTFTERHLFPSRRVVTRDQRHNVSTATTGIIRTRRINRVEARHRETTLHGCQMATSLARWKHGNVGVDTAGSTVHRGHSYDLFSIRSVRSSRSRRSSILAHRM